MGGEPIDKLEPAAKVVYKLGTDRKTDDIQSRMKTLVLPAMTRVHGELKTQE